MVVDDVGPVEVPHAAATFADVDGDDLVAVDWSEAEAETTFEDADWHGGSETCGGRFAEVSLSGSPTSRLSTLSSLSPRLAAA